MNTLDLHGVKHQHVCRQIDLFIYNAISEGKSQIRIVTGDSDSMRNIVKVCLSDYEMIGIEITPGVLTVDIT